MSLITLALPPDFHLHLHADPAVLAAVASLTTTLTQGFNHMSAQMDALAAQVQRNTDVIQSAMTLIQGLKQQILDAGTDQAKLQQIVADLDTQDQQLAEAVAANTPAETP